MKNVMLVGGGKIGVAITEFLTGTGEYKVTVADRDAASLERMPQNSHVTLKEVSVTDEAAFTKAVEGHDAC